VILVVSVGVVIALFPEIKGASSGPEMRIHEMHANPALAKQISHEENRCSLTTPSVTQSRRDPYGNQEVQNSLNIASAIDGPSAGLQCQFVNVPGPSNGLDAESQFLERLNASPSHQDWLNWNGWSGSKTSFGVSSWNGCWVKVETGISAKEFASEINKSDLTPGPYQDKLRRLSIYWGPDAGSDAFMELIAEDGSQCASDFAFTVGWTLPTKASK
jgi:hypothetical protein